MARVGQWFDYQGQIYEAIRIDTLNGGPGRTSQVIVWRAECADPNCAAQFETTSPIRFPFYDNKGFRRRCDAHKQPGKSIGPSARAHSAETVIAIDSVLHQAFLDCGALDPARQPFMIPARDIVRAVLTRRAEVEKADLATTFGFLTHDVNTRVNQHLRRAEANGWVRMLKAGKTTVWHPLRRPVGSMLPEFYAPLPGIAQMHVPPGPAVHYTPPTIPAAQQLPQGSVPPLQPVVAPKAVAAVSATYAAAALQPLPSGNVVPSLTQMTLAQQWDKDDVAT